MSEKVCIVHPLIEGCVSVSPKAVKAWREEGWRPAEEVEAKAAEITVEPTAEEGPEEREEINE